MSLFSTIAHDGATPARGFSPKAIRMMAAGLALGVALGFIIVNNQTATESPTNSAAPAIGLAQDEFIRLNTTSYDGLVPAGIAAATVARSVVDPFIEMNTTAFDGLASAAAVKGQTIANLSENFLNWNIASLEYPAARYFEQSSGPR